MRRGPSQGTTIQTYPGLAQHRSHRAHKPPPFTNQLFTNQPPALHPPSSCISASHSLHSPLFTSIVRRTESAAEGLCGKGALRASCSPRTRAAPHSHPFHSDTYYYASLHAVALAARAGSQVSYLGLVFLPHHADQHCWRAIGRPVWVYLASIHCFYNMRTSPLVVGNGRLSRWGMELLSTSDDVSNAIAQSEAPETTAT
jgi:hypothetical protein